jgi:hypothetical protein
MNDFSCVARTAAGESCLSRLLAGYVTRRACCAACQCQLADTMIRGSGYSLTYEEFCENTETPGLLGQIKGVTNHRDRSVRVSTRNRTIVEMAETLLHELHHVQDPEWDCGNRDVLGRGHA